jgi:hypothetical protein
VDDVNPLRVNCGGCGGLIVPGSVCSACRTKPDRETLVTDHPFTPIPLYVTGDPEPRWTDWCAHLARPLQEVRPEDLCGKLAGEHLQQQREEVADDPQAGWPAHLRDDAPSQQCSGCRRFTWSTSEFGQVCNMPQPDGRRCTGRFMPSDPVSQDLPVADWRGKTFAGIEEPGEHARRAVHPTHDPDLLLALTTPGVGTWCSRCDRQVADGRSIATDHGAEPCPAYRPGPAIMGVS